MHAFASCWSVSFRSQMIQIATALSKTRCDRGTRIPARATALMQTHYRNSLDSWHVQGMYIVTPSGKLLAGGNRSLDVEATLKDMRKGLEAYAKLPAQRSALES